MANKLTETETERKEAVEDWSLPWRCHNFLFLLLIYNSSMLHMWYNWDILWLCYPVDLLLRSTWTSKNKRYNLPTFRRLHDAIIKGTNENKIEFDNRICSCISWELWNSWGGPQGQHPRGRCHTACVLKIFCFYGHPRGHINARACSQHSSPYHTGYI